MPISSKSDNNVNVDANQHKYNQILNTVARITFLTTCVCTSTIICIIVDSAIEITQKSSGVISIGQTFF